MAKKINENVYGINTVANLLTTNPSRIVELFIAPNDNIRIKQLVAIAKSHHISVQITKKERLGRILADDNARHQGIIARCKDLTKKYSDLESLISNNNNVLLLVLDGVQDPHNLGACLRSADAFGATAVIIPKNNAVQITASVRKVASGAAENINIISVTNLVRTLEQLKDLGVWSVGLDPDAKISINKIDLTGNIALVLGAEGKGLSNLTKKTCDYLAAMPMLGTVASLNVSVASGICLFEAIRQRS